MNFSRFEAWLIGVLIFLITGSTMLSLVLVNSRVAADTQVKTAFKSYQETDSLPEIKDIDLTVFYEKVAVFGGKEITLSWNEKSSKISKNDLESFVIEQIDSAVVTADVDQKAVVAYVAKLAKKIDVLAKPRQVTKEGEVIDEGVSGLKLDRDHAKNALLQALLAEGNKKAVLLKIDEVAPGEKIVAKPFTPGLYDGKYVEINLFSQTMYVFEGNTMTNQFSVSTGKWSMPTPEGTFTINNKVDVAYSKRYSLFMPNWMAFVGSKYGIHGLPYQGNWVEGENHLGTPVSHGCVRLSWENARELYDWAEVGTVVYIHN